MENAHLKQPNFLMRLNKEDFKAELCCLGEQLAWILSCIQLETKDLKWYVFDLYGSSNEPINILFPKDKELPYCLVETTNDLIEKVKKVVQFHSGVFIGVRRDKIIVWNASETPETEEDEGLQHPEAEIEIRPFDFSFYEVYGEDNKVEKKLKECLSGIMPFE